MKHEIEWIGMNEDWSEIMASFPHVGTMRITKSTDGEWSYYVAYPISDGGEARTQLEAMYKVLEMCSLYFVEEMEKVCDDIRI